MGWINPSQQARDHAGKRNLCAADGKPGTKTDPLGKTEDGWRIHESHFTDPGDGFYGQQQQD
ncbi:hypothetical protein J5X84_35995 [Streptosporangiaceae bacterium NEAU-GS5]|nr:hypothetical protein [Streptosporangiaceae bacterium NEAU-GS5]